MLVPGAIRTTGRYVRVAITVLVVLGFLPLLVISGARMAGGHANGTAQIAAFAPMAGAGWVVALVVLVLLRSWWVAAFAAVLVAVHVFWMAPAVLERLAANPVPDGTAWHVLTINAQYGGADVGELARVVKQRSIDLVAVQEMTPEFESRFSAAVEDQLPSHVGYRSGDPAGASGIWARWRLQSEGVLGSELVMPKVRAAVPGVGDVQVIGVHALSPIPGRVRAWRKDLILLANQAGAQPGRQIMLGDFNASRDHAPFRQLLSGPLFDAADATVLRPWRGLTWPADRRFIPPSVRIDHVLVSHNDFSVARVRTISINGTDHKGVQVDLVIRANITGSGA